MDDFDDLRKAIADALLKALSKAQIELFEELRQSMIEMVHKSRFFQEQIQNSLELKEKVFKRKELIYIPDNENLEFANDFHKISLQVDLLNEISKGFAEMRDAFIDDFGDFSFTEHKNSKTIDKELMELKADSDEVMSLLPKIDFALEEIMSAYEEMNELLDYYELVPEKDDVNPSDELLFTIKEAHIVKSLLNSSKKRLNKMLKSLENGIPDDFIDLNMTDKEESQKIIVDYIALLQKMIDDPNCLFRETTTPNVFLTLMFIDPHSGMDMEPAYLEFPSVINKIQAHLNYLKMKEGLE